MEEMCDGSYGNKVDEFKKAFKYFKQKASVPSFDNVLDFANEESLNGKVLIYNSAPAFKYNLEGLPLGILHSENWQIYAVKSVPGLSFISNVFSKEQQMYWSEKCLRDYTKSPYVTNLDAFLLKERVDEVWSTSTQTISGFKQPKDLNLLRKTPVWDLRWSTIGYHHDWNTKKYQEKKRSSFPHDLAKMCSYITKSLGLTEFVPEAAIVNYYHVGSTLSPHKDVSEADLSFPLLSVSFGLPAIFLIGGATRDTTPTPILIRSGDVIVMSGPSRTAYHALPRVMPKEGGAAKADDPLSLYLEHSRININIRQVQSEEFPLQPL